MYWYNHVAKEKDVIVSSRVRLARNLNNYPFTGRLQEEDGKKMLAEVNAVYEKNTDYTILNMSDISATEAMSLCERHYISREFASSATPRLLIRNSHTDVAIMVGEEDHLRIQCIKNGLALDEAFAAAMNEEAQLDQHLHFAFSETLGYLTHCPTNLGTAMRISVMMHLPALTMSGRMDALNLQLQKIGLVIRGMYGEGSKADGSLYQISNQITLGITEEETLQKVSDVVHQIAEQERSLRSAIKGEAWEKIMDKAQRAEGILRTARLISSAEFLSLYTAARLGCTIGNTSCLTCELLDTILFEVMPATMALSGYTAGETELPQEMRRDKSRAILIQKTIAATLPKAVKAPVKKQKKTPLNKEVN